MKWTTRLNHEQDTAPAAAETQTPRMRRYHQAGAVLDSLDTLLGSWADSPEDEAFILRLRSQVEYLRFRALAYDPPQGGHPRKESSE